MENDSELGKHTKAPFSLSMRRRGEAGERCGFSIIMRARILSRDFCLLSSFGHRVKPLSALREIHMRAKNIRFDSLIENKRPPHSTAFNQHRRIGRNECLPSIGMGP